MATIGSLVAELSLNSAAFQKDLGKATAALNSSAAQMNRSLAKIERDFKSMNATVGGILTVGLGRAFVGAINKSMEFADSIAEMGKKTGLGTKALQELQYVQSQSGGSVKSFNEGITKFTALIGDAANGSKVAADALKRVGISVDDLRKMNMEQLYVKASDTLSKYADEATRASAIQDAFGKSALESASAFSVSAGELDELRRAAQASGAILDETTIANAKKAKDEMDAFSRVISIELTQAFVQVAPLLVKGAHALAEVAEMAGWAARRIGLLADVTAEQQYQTLLEKRLDTSEKLYNVEQLMKDNASADLIRANKYEPLRKELAALDKQIVDINMRKNAMKDVAGPKVTPAVTGSIVPTGGFATQETFEKLLQDLTKASEKAQTDILSDETQKSEARRALARGEWLFKAEQAKLGASQTQKFMQELDIWEASQRDADVAAQMEKDAQDESKRLKDYETLRASLDESYAAKIAYRDQLAQLDRLYDEGAINDDVAYKAMREQIELEHQARLGNIVAQGQLERLRFSRQTSMQQTQFVLGELLNLTQGVATHNKTLFKLNQAAGISNAIVNTYVGVTKALAAYPPPLSFIMAGAQLVAGMAQVSAIKGAKFGGGSSAPSVGGGSAVPVTPADGMASPPDVSTSPIRAPAVINVSLEGSGRYSAEEVRDLISQIQEQMADGAGAVQ